MSSRWPSSADGIPVTRADEGTDSLRLLFVIGFPPRFDTKHGGRVVAQLLAQLVERHRVAVVHRQPAGAPPMDPSLSSRCDLVEAVEVPANRWPVSRWRHRMNVVTSLVTSRPAPASTVFSRGLPRTVRRIAERWRPDIVQIEHDTIGYCARAIDRGPGAGILSCHEPGLRASRDLVRATTGATRVAHRIDVAAWPRYWSRSLPRLDAVVAFTSGDAEVLHSVLPDLRVFLIPLGVDVPPEPLSPTGSGQPSIAFVGGYVHPPNADAALRLITSIMPIARERIPDIRLLVVGDSPTAEMRAAARPLDMITGTVEAVEPYLNDAAILVLPLRLGGGMRVKLLEGLAAGKAVVASPLAAAGLAVTSGREIVLAENDQDFADAIVALLEDEPLRASIGANAREWASRNLRWEQRAREYEQMYRAVLASRRAAAARDS